MNRSSDGLEGQEFRDGYPLLVLEGRSASFALPAAAVVRVMESAPLGGDPPFDLSEALELDPTRNPTRVLELRVDRDLLAVKTFGPVSLRIATQAEVLPLPDLVRGLSAAALIDRLALVDGIARLWILDPRSLLRAAARARALGNHDRASGGVVVSSEVTK